MANEATAEKPKGPGKGKHYNPNSLKNLRPRKKGMKNKRTRETEEIFARAGLCPIEAAIQVVREAQAAGDHDIVLRGCQILLPYYAPRLGRLEVKAKVENERPVVNVDYTGMRVIDGTASTDQS